LALIFKTTKCAICGEVFETDAPRVATTHFVDDENDPLCRFSDAVMHSSCFQSWEQREEFVRKYNNTIGQIVWGNGTRHHMKADGEIEIVSAESPPTPYIGRGDSRDL
jgi:hypothetical protein